MAAIGVGSKLGRYEIVSEIGKGGMSVVYRALDEQLERDVAIKVMHNFLAKDGEACKRFHREAVAVARLHHPNIIDIYDYSGEDASTSYIVTELVEGQSLAQFLRERQIGSPPELAILVARPIADALVHAHAEGIIHRDLKPENILIGNKGVLKLTDFGIARMLDTQTMTMTGTLLGSPAFMAPEYIEGKATDARVDIFSFGAMLYQLTTGQLPFHGDTPAALLHSITMGQYVPPNQLNPDIHAGIARVIERSMAHNPDERYRDAESLREAIDMIVDRLALTDTAPEQLEGALSSSQEYGDKIAGELVGCYLTLGRQAMADGNTGQALDDFDRVLSLQPSHPEVTRILGSLNRRQWARSLLTLLTLGCLVVALGLGVASVWPEKEPVSQSPETTIVNTLDPKPQPAVLSKERSVTFVIEGSGDLYIDGVRKKEKVTGPVSVEVLPGQHEVRLAGSEGVDDRKQISVSAQGPVDPVLLDVRPPKSPPPASSSSVSAHVKKKKVEIKPGKARWVNLYVDGELMAKDKMAPFHIELAYGEHTLRFSNPAAKPTEVPLVVSDTEPREKVIHAPAFTYLDAKLIVKNAPIGTLVKVKGARGAARLINESTRGEPIFVELPVGEPSVEREVVLKRQGWTWKKTVTLRANMERLLEVPPDEL